MSQNPKSTISAVEVFIFDSGQFTGSRMFSSSRVITIGSAPDSAIVLSDPHVAPQHAVIYVQNDKLIISDNNSPTGVSVNGQKVRIAEISGFDEIELGRSRVKVEPVMASNAPAPAAPAPTPAPAATRTGSKKPASFAPKSASSVKSKAPEPTGDAPILHQLEEKLDSLFPGLGERREPTRPGPLKAEDFEIAEGSDTSVPAMNILSVDEAAETKRHEVPEREVLEPSYPELGEAESFADTQIASTAIKDEVEVFAIGEPSEEDLDEEELEEQEFVPPFSLLDNIIRDRFELPIRGEPETVVEVISYRDDRLIDILRIERGKKFSVYDDGGRKQPLIQHKRQNQARLFFQEGAKGNIVVGGESTPLSEMCTDDRLVHKKNRVFGADLAEGDFAHVRIGSMGYLMRFVRAPLPPPHSFEFEMTKNDRTYLGLAFCGVLLILVAVWIEAMISPSELLAMEEEVEFAEVSLKDLELEKLEEPPKPPEPEPVPEPEPEPPADTKAPEPPPEPPKREKAPPPKKTVKRSPGPPRGGGEPGPSQAQQQANQALAALQNLAPQSSGKQLSAAVSNIAAVRVPSGATKRFQVAGAIAKIPGSDVVLSTSGGGGGRDTRSAANLLAGNTVGTLSGGGGGGGGKVRGVVKSSPSRNIGTEGGSLSRAEILKVVNRGIADVQRCYERQLLKNPGLQGKIVFDWVISPSGGVASTRVRSSSLQSEAVAQCIAGVIRGWVFPQPTGGSVKVTYPFVFAIQGF